jgi:hypothetical protein
MQSLTDESELDPALPYWKANADASQLLSRHGYRTTRVDAWIERILCPRDEDDHIFGLFTEMRGRFTPGVFCSRTHQFTFTPDSRGPHNAMVMAVRKGDVVVDLIGIWKGDDSIWGCVTGYGTMLGVLVPDSPTRVYKTLRQWLLYGCDGVMPLAKSAFPDLSVASQLIAEDLDHMDELSYRVFFSPAFYDDRGESQEERCRTVRKAEADALQKIAIDTDRCDVDNEILDRCARSAICIVGKRASS